MMSPTEFALWLTTIPALFYGIIYLIVTILRLTQSGDSGKVEGENG